ncbi:hypothetical protein PGN35_023965 [Nodosilinea sp. PGN35]
MAIRIVAMLLLCHQGRSLTWLNGRGDRASPLEAGYPPVAIVL